MKRNITEIRKKIFAGLLCCGMVMTAVLAEQRSVQAEEITLESTAEAEQHGMVVFETVETEARKGTYPVEEDWIRDSEQSTDEKEVYIKKSYEQEKETSTITCTYIDTNYSVLEYEQLRDMLTNNLFYSNVDAKISTSAVYTLDKDYLYILIVDDSSQDYRDIYHYVVGDYRCFEVSVHEYRAEAEAAKAAEEDTPQETGQKIAEEFVWDVQ